MGTVPGSSFAARIQFILGFTALIGKIMRAANNGVKGHKPGEIYKVRRILTAEAVPSLFKSNCPLRTHFHLN